MRNYALASLALAVTLPSVGCVQAGTCEVADNGDGTATLSCDDGGQFDIASGNTGADGNDGATGADGENGENGDDGENCTVEQANGVTTITCPDGSIIEIPAGSGGGGLPTIPTLEGSFTVGNAADIAILQAMSVTEITGSLTINAVGLTDLSGLSALTAVGSMLRVWGFDGTSLSGLENLASVGGLELATSAATNLTDVSAVTGVTSLTEKLVVFLPAITAVSFPNLTSVGGNCSFSGPLLTSLTLPMLTSCGEGFTANNADVLQTISLPELLDTGTGRINIQKFGPPQGSMTTSISMPKLTTTKGLYLLEQGSLASIDFGSLATVGTDGVILRTSNSLTTASFPELTTVDGSFSIQSNPIMDTIEAPKLTSAVHVGILNSPFYAQCACQNLAAQAGASSTCSGLDSNASCP